MPRLKHRSQLGHSLLGSDLPPVSESPDFLGYPRPQFRRTHWVSLNGEWEFALDADAAWTRDQVLWERTIRVPFAPEKQASGVADTGL